MDYSLDELIGHPTKKRKTRKRRDNNEANARKEVTIVISGVPTPLESTMEEALGLPAIEPEVDNSTGDVEVAPPVLMEIERWQRWPWQSQCLCSSQSRRRRRCSHLFS